MTEIYYVYQPLLQAVSQIGLGLRIPHGVENREPFTAERKLKMDIVIRRGLLRDAPENRGKALLLDMKRTRTSCLQMGMRLKCVGDDHRASAAYEAPGVTTPALHPFGTGNHDDRSHNLCGWLLRLGVSGSSFIDKLGASSAVGRGKLTLGKKENVQGARLALIVSVST